MTSLQAQTQSIYGGEDKLDICEVMLMINEFRDRAHEKKSIMDTIDMFGSGTLSEDDIDVFVTTIENIYLDDNCVLTSFYLSESEDAFQKGYEKSKNDLIEYNKCVDEWNEAENKKPEELRLFSNYLPTEEYLPQNFYVKIGQCNLFGFQAFKTFENLKYQCYKIMFFITYKIIILNFIIRYVYFTT